MLHGRSGSAERRGTGGSKAFKTEQRWLDYRGRRFHFVSYDGTPANEKRGQPATTPAWWLMRAGRRWKVMPFFPDWDEAELDRALTEWLDAHAFPSLDEREG